MKSFYLLKVQIELNSYFLSNIQTCEIYSNFII